MWNIASKRTELILKKKTVETKLLECWDDLLVWGISPPLNQPWAWAFLTTGDWAPPFDLNT